MSPYSCSSSAFYSDNVYLDYTQKDIGKCEYCGVGFKEDEDWDGRCDACGAPLPIADPVPMWRDT